MKNNHRLLLSICDARNIKFSCCQAHIDWWLVRCNKNWVLYFSKKKNSNHHHLQNQETNVFFYVSPRNLIIYFHWKSQFCYNLMQIIMNLRHSNAFHNSVLFNIHYNCVCECCTWAATVRTKKVESDVSNKETYAAVWHISTLNIRHFNNVA